MTADAVVTFDLPLDQRFRGQGRTVEVNRWLELDGNNIRIVDLELYPTHARLNLEQDPDNAEELQSLDFYLEDKKGNRYEKGSASGLTAMGDSYLSRALISAIRTPSPCTSPRQSGWRRVRSLSLSA